MAPLAGKPPFATDEPESFYESSPQPQRRVRQPAPADPNKRSSAYDVYDNYLGDDKNKLQPPAGSANRNSGGMGALGMGLLNMDDDSDSDDDDEDNTQRTLVNPPGIGGSPSKHAALAAAVSPSRPSPPPQQQRQPQQPSSPQQPPSPRQMPGPNQLPQQMRTANQQSPSIQQQQQMRQPQLQDPFQPQQIPGSLLPGQQFRPQAGPQPIAAPRPGYAAPIAALNLARPEPSAGSAGRELNPNGPNQLRIQNPFEPPFAQIRPPFASPASPAPSLHASTPHPLLPPVTPITPAFIRPSKSPAPNEASVKFSEGVARPRKPIMRGNSEETLLPGRGEKGDDFWRRFSIVAKEENKKPGAMKESSWLKKTRSGSNRLSRSVWLIGIVLIILIGGGIAVAVYFTRGTPDHQQPTVLGGAADNRATAGTGSTTPTVGTAKVTSSSKLHVSPTHTVDRRENEPFITAAPGIALRAHAKRRIEESW
ncbi:hypothetical protein B0H34DRAFT_797324 [Crassisporium funariophilum]|nr:hypothetical protein B0H34DRAFT_797324 [Crassisporium funariophilum]